MSETKRVVRQHPVDFKVDAVKLLEATGPAAVWLRLGNTRKAALLNWLEPLLPEVLAALERGETLLEIV